MTPDKTSAPPFPETFQLTLKCLPDDVAPEIRCRQLLKFALRTTRFRCLGIEGVDTDQAVTPADGAGGTEK